MAFFFFSSSFSSCWCRRWWCRRWSWPPGRRPHTQPCHRLEPERSWSGRSWSSRSWWVKTLRGETQSEFISRTSFTSIFHIYSDYLSSFSSFKVWMDLGDVALTRVQQVFANCSWLVWRSSAGEELRLEGGATSTQVFCRGDLWISQTCMKEEHFCF